MIPSTGGYTCLRSFEIPNYALPLLPAAPVRRGIERLLCRDRQRRATACLCLFRGGARPALSGSPRTRRDALRPISPSFQTCYAKLAMKRISAMRKRWPRIVPLVGMLALMTEYASAQGMPPSVCDRTSAHSRRRNVSARSKSTTITRLQAKRFPIKRRMTRGPSFDLRRPVPFQKRSSNKLTILPR